MIDKIKNLKIATVKKKLIAYGVIGFFLGTCGYVFLTPNYYENYSPVEFHIQKGSSLTKVVDNLYDKHIIPNKIALKIAAFLLRAESGIKAGRYEIPNGLSYFGLVDLILKGQPAEATLVTIQEGIWQHNMASLLNEQLGIDADEFMRLSKDKNFIESLGLKTDNLEGYLIPDTYYFTNSSDAESVIKKLVLETNRFFCDSLKQRMQVIGMDLKQVLTLASIVDGETNIESEFKRIAGVYLNRIKKRMKLQADPTIQYLIRNRRRHNRIYYKDLEIDSPYNTYKYKGLPPGPINNPGKQAVLAVLYPEEHDYLYFVADGNGGHKFARTYSQHLKNVRDYRRNRGR